ncbi:ATP-binding cassette domain-containing protein [Streptomyces sp. NPDC001922]|uniref:ATP-binding cassette domain-containing protein n=1 Tax=Streptomyces sp. NPDC001922 TaxID=3364624 RepID=UPI0036C9C6AD
MDSTPHGAAVTAVGLGLEGPRGWAFRDIDINAEPGALIAVEGPSGTGRTCLLLALTGRMRATAGHAEIAGLRLPKKMAAVRGISALGPVAGVSELDPALTVAEHLRERALLQRRFSGSLREFLRPRTERAAEGRRRIDAALRAAGLDLDSLPKGPRTAVRDLERLEVLRMSVALALMNGPRLLAVDDTDLKLSDAEREQAWAMLRDVAGGGTTVLAVCSEAPKDALIVSTGRERPAGRDTSPDGAGKSASRSERGGKRKAKPAATAAERTGEDASRPAGRTADLTKDRPKDRTENRTENRASAGDGTQGALRKGTAKKAAKKTAEQDGPASPARTEEPAPTEDRATTDDRAAAEDTGRTPAQTADEPGEDRPAEAQPTRNEKEEGAADALAETGRA